MVLVGDKTLILAAGGGFDIVSVQFLRKKILKQYPNMTVDTAGWLNPKFDHFIEKENFDSLVFENAVNIYNKITRYRRKELNYSTKHPDYEWYCENGEEKAIVENELAVLLDEKMISFSTRYECNEICNFILSYNNFIVCDIGGDILYSGKKDNEVKTPLIDGFSMSILSKLYDKINCYLVVAGIGTDEELYRTNLQTNIENIRRADGIYKKGELLEEDVIILSELYNKVIDKYGGGTIRNIIDIWNSTNKNEELINQNMRNYQQWFNLYIILKPEIVCKMSIFSDCSSISDVSNCLLKHGWSFNKK